MWPVNKSTLRSRKQRGLQRIKKEFRADCNMDHMDNESEVNDNLLFIDCNDNNDCAKKIKIERQEDSPSSSETDDNSDKIQGTKRMKVLKPNTKKKPSNLEGLLEDSSSDDTKENLSVKEINKSSVHHASQIPQQSANSRWTTQMDNKLSTIINELEELKKMVATLLDNSLSENKTNYIVTKEQLSEKYQLKFPINDLDTFDKLNELTKTNSSFKKDFCEVLKQYVDRNHSISRSCVTILKMILTKKIAEQFVAQREKEGKRALNTSCFFSCLKEAIIKDRASAGLITTEKEILSKVGDVLSNTKKWADQSDN